LELILYTACKSKYR